MRPRWSVEGKGWPNAGASRLVRAGGIEWHVQTGGSGPALLLLHGTGASTHSWRDVAPLLAKRFTVVAPDLPGHGFTAPLPAGQSLPGMARAVAALLGELGIEPALAAGHSAGAAILARMAVGGGLACPIVAFGGALLPFPGPAQAIFPAVARLLFVNPFAPRLFAWQAGLPGVVEKFLAKSTGSRIDARGAELYARLFACAGHCEGALGMMANWDLAGLRRDLPRLARPLLLVHGDRDAAIPVSASREVAGLVPGAELLVKPGLGHLLHEEEPELAAELVAGFGGRQGLPL